MNWTPSEDHRYRLQQTVNHLTNRYATLMEEDYPLDQEGVTRIVSPPRLLEFIGLGYDSLQKTHQISYELGPEQGVGRRSITMVALPTVIQFAFSRSLNDNYNANKPMYFNREGISDEMMEKLVKWTDKAVYHRRLAMMVTTTVDLFMTHTLNISMYQIMARWPGLKVVFPRVAQQIYGRAPDIWERHSNEVPRNLQRWGWPALGLEAEFRLKYDRRMRLAEEVLLSCVSLPEPKNTGNYQTRKLTAKLTDWQKLGGMPF